MTVPTKIEETGEHKTMEERLAEVGARMDNLIARATETKQRVEGNIKDAKEVSHEAYEELKTGLDKAWHEVNQAWAEITSSTERAAKKLQPHKSCCSQEKQEEQP